jgi:Flp pilus assembly protein CpaB
LLGAILALLAFFVLYLGLSANSGPRAVVPPTPVPPKVQVLVAAKDIPSYTVIKADDVTIQEMEASQVLSGTTTQPNDVVGQVLTRNYAANSQILTTDIAPPGISQILTKGQRGFALPVLEVNNFGGQLNDNDVVDVLWSRNFEVVQDIVGADGKPTQYIKQLPTTKKILDNVKVLRVIHLVAGQTNQQSSGPVNKNAYTPQGGDQTQQNAQQTAANQALYAKDAPPSAVLILAINDQQAEVIKFARENGVVDLTLRAKDDTDVERTTGITDKIMSEDYGVVLPEVLIK